MGTTRFVYQLMARPSGPHTTPDGPGRECHDTDVLSYGRGHGSVSYTKPLSIEDIQHYSLIAITEMAELNGKEFRQEWGKLAIRHRVRLTENGMALQVDSECEGVPHTEMISYPDFLKRAYRWIVA